MRKLMIFTAFLCATTICWSQDLTDYAPPSPEVASLLRVSQPEINEVTGKPNISILLFSNEYRGFPINVNLTYDQNGLLVESESSWVGNSWTVQYGGYINRKINGLPDEEKYEAKFWGQYDVFNNGSQYCNRLKIFEKTRFIQTNNDIYQMAKYFYNNNGSLSGYTGNTNTHNEEPDIFNYLLPNGISGSFVFNNEGTSQYLITDSNNFKVEFNADLTNGVLNSFTITDLNGYQYLFNEVEKRTINSRNFHTTVSGPKDGVIRYPEYGLVDELNTTSYVCGEPPSEIGANDLYYKEYNHTWHLKEIIPPYGEKIVFSYETKKHVTLSSVNSEISPWNNYINRYNDYHTKVIKDITWENGKLEFNLKSTLRLDTHGDSELKALDNITLKNTNGDVIRKVSFNTSYSNAVGIQNITLESERKFFRRLWLNGITINNHTTSPSSYSFDYNSNPLPSRVSFEQDYWGYYNGNGADTNLATQIPNLWFYPDDNYSYTRINAFSIFRRQNYVGRELRLSDPNFPQEFINSLRPDGGTNTSSLFADRESDLFYAKSGILEEVTYPTGGKMVLEYELNDFLVEGQVITGNGLRVQRTYLMNGSIIESDTNYEYKDGTNQTSGRVIELPLYGTVSLSTTNNPPSDYYKLYSHRKNRSGLLNVFYGTVTKKTSALGKIVSTYDVPVDVNSENEFWSNYHQKYFYQKNTTISNMNTNYYSPLRPLTYNLSNIIGKLKEKRYYNQQNNLVKEDVITYEFTNSSQKLFYLYKHLPASNSRPLHTILMAETKPIKSTERTYGTVSGNQIVEQEYIYNDHALISELKVKSTDEEVQKTKYFYPDDVISASSLGNQNLTSAEYSAIDKLKHNNNHRLAEIVQTETYEDNQLISITRNLFKEWFQNSVFLERVKIAKGNATLEDRILFLDFDNIGNPTELSKVEGAKVKYVWGYNQTRPIAKIEGYTTITTAQQNAIDDAISTSNNETNGATEGNLRVKLNTLRDSFASSGALVTSFTYDPLKGVTSMTNSRGQTIFYYYDSFNRLEYIKDAYGNIVSANQYNYKN